MITWAVLGIVGRLPVASTFVVLVMSASSAESLHLGLQLAGAASIATGIALPLWGLALDTWAAKRVLSCANILTALTFTAEWLAFTVHADAALLFCLAIVHGAAVGAIIAGYRTSIPALVPASRVLRTNVLDVALIESAYLCGPLIVGAAAAVLSPETGLLILACAALASTATLRWSSNPSGPANERQDRRPREFRAMAVVVCGLGCGLLNGFVFAGASQSAVELLPGSSGLAAVTAMISLGSMIAGLVFALSSQPDRVRIGHLSLVAAAYASAVLIISVLASANQTWMTLAGLLVVGLPIAPLASIPILHITSTIPLGGQSRWTGLFHSLILCGTGIGNSLSGTMFTHLSASQIFVRTAFVGAVITGVLRLLTRRRTGS